MRLALTLILLSQLTGCMRDPERMANIRDIGDAINHCRRYTEQVMPADTAVAIDRLSTRENADGYDIYLRVSDKNNNGWVRCQVDEDGYIDSHRIYGMRHEGPSIFTF
ncbi:hypothetical protein GCM10011297_33870 [Bacterioplanes sanyensis]|uniref:hypothetical protein n=1 Tax=Bacterioplanes sanyensis TaxID=1249553 RepID=UPI001672B601|nr:hypothetical protein [Bacterioplanes sanyensis]GGY58400.1 hypothetical protein GCM10011297_33870 [Bacterioplanes sanyensis]